MLDQRPHILVADDESLFLLSTLELLRQVGYRCTGAANAHEALAVLGSQPVDALIADLNMPGNLQLELLHQGRERHPHVPIIVVTGVPTLHSAIDSVRLGISDYLLKPVKFDDLLASLKRVLENWHAQTTAPQPADGAAEASVRERLIGESPRIREIVEIIGRVAATDTSVLLTGESGTGKEVVAQAIHRASGRRSGPFVPIDCAAIPESLFESTLFGHARGAFTGAVADQAGLLQLCNGGTAFLDEIGEMPPMLQAKLLRVIQHAAFKPVGRTEDVRIDTRFIAATNRDLSLEVKQGKFRQDLFYRLGVVQIWLPPLRERGEDVLLLAEHFRLELAAVNRAVVGFTPEVLECFLGYSWPGNVRELRNVIERALTLTRGDRIALADLPPELQSIVPDTAAVSNEPAIRSRASRLQAVSDAEHAYLVNLLQTCGGNVSRAAQEAGITRQGFYKLLEKHGLSAGSFRP